jgi:hypothetical protein
LLEILKESLKRKQNGIEVLQFLVYKDEIPCSAQQNSQFHAEQGIIRSALELQRKIGVRNPA